MDALGMPAGVRNGFVKDGGDDVRAGEDDGDFWGVVKKVLENSTLVGFDFAGTETENVDGERVERMGSVALQATQDFGFEFFRGLHKAG